jgi:4-amino-4-deoxy-L-arabinose transferase-like glycosyltransferase
VRTLVSTLSHLPHLDLVALTFVGVLLRAVRLSFQPLWWDEGYSVWFATHSLGQMAALTAEDIHPPLYYALLHGWTSVLGAGPIALRLFSVLCGVLAIPVLYAVGRRLLGSRQGGLWAALLLAVNPLHIYYSQEIRMYGLVALLSAAILAVAWEVLEREDTLSSDVAWLPRSLIGPLILYILLTTAALYTQYYAAFLPVSLTVYVAWRWRRRGAPLNDRALIRWLGAQAAALALYLPWLLYATPRLIPYVSQKIGKDADQPLDFVTYIARHLSAYLGGHLEGSLAAYWPVVLVLLVPVVVGLARRPHPPTPSPTGRGGARADDTPPFLPREGGAPRSVAGGLGSAQGLALCGTVVLMTLVLGFLISLRAPFFPMRGERLLLLGLPPFLVIAAAGLDALWADKMGWGRKAAWVALGLIGLVVTASLTAFYTVPRYPGDDYRPLIARTVEQGLPGDTVLCIYPWQVGYWRSYAPADAASAVLTPSPAWGPALAGALDAALARGHVWFPAHLALGGITETQVEAYLGQHARLFANQWYGPGTRLSGWAAPAGAAASLAVMPVNFMLPSGETLTLSAVAGETGPIAAANAMTPLTLSWQAAHAPADALAVSVRLVDGLGQMWAQNDYEPLGGLTFGSAVTGMTSNGWQAQDSLGLLIPAGTPPGRYTVQVTVHPKNVERPLEAAGADGKRLGTAAPLYALTAGPADRPLTADRLPIATRQTVDMGDGLRFLGSSADPGPVAPGQRVRVSLFWQTTTQPAADYKAFVQLLDGQGNVKGLWEAAPGAAYPTTQWAADTLIRTQADFRPPADLPDGRYPLIAGLFRFDNGQRLRAAGGADHLTLGYVTVRGRPHQMTAPHPAHPLNTTLGALATLTGYDLTPPAGGYRPGASIPLTLYWRAEASTDRQYTVFVHLVDANGGLRGFGDDEPGSGRYPTPGWVKGEYLADAHTVTIDPAAPPGVYRLVIGLYDPATGQRLVAPDGADAITLDTEIRVIAP